MAKVKEFQKHIIDDADFKDTIAGDHVCEFRRFSPFSFAVIVFYPLCRHA
jgi:hypothetical protein